MKLNLEPKEKENLKKEMIKKLELTIRRAMVADAAQAY